MNELHIHRLDLNLLRVLDVLLQERNATRAGARLGLSQSAVSHALGRLRYALDDELFHRDPRGLKPTPRALEIGPQVHSALTQLEAAFAPTSFEAATTERRFVLMAGAYTCGVLVPRLVERMAREAPNAGLVIAEFGPDILDQLDGRRADFVIGGFASGPERLVQEVLLTEYLVWVVRAENPLPSGPISLQTLVSVPHVVIARSRTDWGSGLTIPGSWEDADAFEAVLHEHGLKRRIGVTTPDTYSAVSVVRQSDMAALLPSRMANLTKQSGLLRVLEPPYVSPKVELGLIYLADRMADPALVWMRDLLRQVAAEV
ncbi:LysR family transcriptional regulator [Phenylobacterium aquaticum]|uniref:LysR family transcriptional regulator n=1 Tax=Phenylobacterium aquaticum TaxID=1763816 RepID=UPI0026F35F19|nr:LysR family transcriptional regulator [Phenylobacterium aquaticum]